MLISLSIRNLVLIEHLDLFFEPGLSVLTGETGAGKSVLLDALGLALGMRGDASLIRAGADQSSVTAEFVVPSTHPICDLLNEQELPFQSPILFRRVIMANGRSRAFINNHLVSVAFLRELGNHLLEIHGQFDRLLDSSTHRILLDNFLDSDALREEVSSSYHVWQACLQKWQKENQYLETLKREEDFLRFQLSELNKLNLQENEEETLLSKRQALSHFGRLHDAVQNAWKCLGGTTLLDAIHGGQRALQKIQDLQDSKTLIVQGSLEKALVEVTEAISVLEEIQDSLEDGPDHLLKIDDRLHVLRAAARKYGVTTAELPVYYTKLSEDLNSVDQAEERAQQLFKEAAHFQKRYVDSAVSLRQKRQQAALDLERAVLKELPALKLPQARFKVFIEDLPEERWSAQGIDQVEFQIAMNKGQSFCALSKAASGGELARLMLSLKAVLAARSEICTIVFDEIDVGVGGAVAAAIGERFNTLAQNIQVIAITHSPQVAASAKQHYYVSKQDDGDKMRTNVIPLLPDKRCEELARMLSGARITEEARAAARSLLCQYA